MTEFDGRKYVDMSLSGIATCVLGYADPDVTAAAVEAVKNGVMFTPNPPKEVELTELLLAIHPWAQRMRLGPMGGETMGFAKSTPPMTRPVLQHSGVTRTAIPFRCLHLETSYHVGGSGRHDLRSARQLLSSGHTRMRGVSN